MRGALAKWRWAGVGVIWDATEPDPEPLTAVATAAPQVSLTVIYAQAGAYLNVGGLVYDPRILAVPQQREAITEGTGETAMCERVAEEPNRQILGAGAYDAGFQATGLIRAGGNSGATNVTDDKWAETHGNGGK